MNHNKKWKGLVVVVFYLMVYGITAVSIVSEDKGYSAVENRVLQKFPKISKKRIFNGKFQEKYEVYLSDQFPARDGWIQIKSQAEKLAGKTEANGVYFGKDGYLLEKYTKEDFDEKQVKKNIRALQEFVEALQAGELTKKSVDTKVMFVPSKTEIYQDYLPLFAQSYDESVMYEKIKKALPENVLVSAAETLKQHKQEQLYYRTDHHWTTFGAWYGYEAYRTACGDGEENKSEMDQKKEALKVVSEDFLGTTYSKVNLYSKKDEISVYEPEGEFSIVYNMGEKTENTFYQWKFLETKDQYSVFSGGNQGVLEITGGKQNGKTLLLVKDSFANCMIPFLMEDYEKIVVLDMRQLNVKMSYFVEMYQPTNVLVLYNLEQFLQDQAFAG